VTTKREALRKYRRTAVVCDYCLNEAYDLGVEGYEAQADIMRELGLELPDHLCDETEEPDLNIRCGCACQSERTYD
jgi:hypothetical protein